MADNEALTLRVRGGGAHAAVAQAGARDGACGGEQAAEGGRLQRRELLPKGGARPTAAAAGARRGGGQQLRQPALHHLPEHVQ